MSAAARLRDFAGFARRFGMPLDADACLEGATALDDNVRLRAELAALRDDDDDPPGPDQGAGQEAP